MNILEEATVFENEKHSLKTTSDRINVSNKAKHLILEINKIYKEKKEQKLMDLMKRLTVIKKNAEKRLNLEISY